MTLRRWLITGPTFLIASVINPAYFSGCGDSQPNGFTFDEQDMVRLVQALNDADPIEFSANGADYTLAFVLRQRAGEDRDDTVARTPSAWARPVYACGTRTFLQSAAACITTSEMPVSGTVTLHTRGEDALPAQLIVQGTLRVDGYQLREATLDLNDQVDTISLRGDAAGKFELVVFDAPNLGDGGGDIQFMR